MQLKSEAQRNYLIMKTINNKEKDFDAVKMMREIRTKISAETQNMSFDELKKYIEQKTKPSLLKSHKTHRTL